MKSKHKPQKVNAIMDYVRPFAESTQTNKQSSLSVEEVDDHDECDVDERDEALPTCPSDEDFVLGEIGESRDQLSSAVRIRVGLLILSSKMYVYSITKNRLEIYFEFS